jgi:hypothetical protein
VALNAVADTMNQEPDSRSVRRIVLPSGRAIDLVRSAPKPAAPHGLHVCPECSSNLVQPLEWGEGAGGSWELTLQCPNCHWLVEGVYAREQIDHFEERLDDGLADMLSDLRRLTQANMAEEIERFIAALHADVILPEDF